MTDTPKYKLNFCHPLTCSSLQRKQKELFITKRPMAVDKPLNEENKLNKIALPSLVAVISELSGEVKPYPFIIYTNYQSDPNPR